MKISSLILLPLLFAVRPVFSQDKQTVDSLNQAYHKARTDSVKSNILHRLFEEHLRWNANKARQFAKVQLGVAKRIRDPKFLVVAQCDFGQLLRIQGSNDSSIVEYTAALKSAEKAGLNKEVSRALTEIGVNYYYKGDYSKAIEHFERNLNFCIKINDQTGVSSAYNSLGNVSYTLGDYSKALDWYVKAARKNMEQGDERRLAVAQSNIGRVEMQLGNYKSAIQYYKSCKRIYDKLKDGNGSHILQDIGLVYKKMEQYDSALYYYNEALPRFEKAGDRRMVSEVIHNKGSLYETNKDYEKAEKEFLKALAISVELQDSAALSDDYVALGTIYHAKGADSLAKKYLLMSSDFARQFKRPLNLIQSEQLLALIYRREGDYRNAYEREHSSRILQDSLFNLEKRKLADEIETKYKTEQHEQQIELLRAENDLKTQQVQNQERERFYLISLAIVIFVLGIVLYNRYTIKNRAHLKLAALDKLKSRFFANISHEFRTPLTLISGCLEDLSKNAEGNENQVRMSIMQKNTTRLRQLIEQLLDLSKLESGKLKLNVAPMNPGNFLKAITSSFSSWAAQKQIVLTVDISEQPVLAYMDEDIVEKIVSNLLSNAIKFTPQRGSVSIAARWDEDELNVYVKDNGLGIPASKINQIFERFYQVDDSNTRSQEGSGIGLALVKELVSLHHGQISVESQPDAGTSFKVTIPIHEKHYSSSEIGLVQKNGTSKTPVEFNKNTPLEIYSEFEDGSSESPIILVVEDNIDLGQYIGDHLPDCEIILAANGKEGLNKAIRHVPDLIISDVMMPEMDGVELCKKIKEEEKTSHIPVILLTAKADIESRLEGLETGADDYITKPFDARELQTRAKNLIVQREKLRERFSRTVILKPQDIAITSPDEIFLEKVMAIVETHLSDSEFSVDDFQKEVGMSRMQLHRKLKALTGHSTGEFMRIQRLIRASQMLSQGHGNITDICYQTGFTSLSYFAKCFKRQFGTTPKDFVALHIQEP